MAGLQPEFLFTKVCGHRSSQDCKAELDQYLLGSLHRIGYSTSSSELTSRKAVTASKGSHKLALNLMSSSRKRFGEVLRVIANNVGEPEERPAREVPWVVSLADALPRDMLILSQTQTDLRGLGMVFGQRPLLLFYFLSEQRGWFSEVDVADGVNSFDVTAFIDFAESHLRSSSVSEIRVWGAKKFVREHLREIEHSAGSDSLKREFGLRELSFLEKLRKFFRTR